MRLGINSESWSLGKLWDSWSGHIGAILILLNYYLWTFSDIISLWSILFSPW